MSSTKEILPPAVIQPGNWVQIIHSREIVRINHLGRCGGSPCVYDDKGRLHSESSCKILAFGPFPHEDNDLNLNQETRDRVETAFMDWLTRKANLTSVNGCVDAYVKYAKLVQEHIDPHWY